MFSLQSLKQVCAYNQVCVHALTKFQDMDFGVNVCIFFFYARAGLMCAHTWDVILIPSSTPITGQRRNVYCPNYAWWSWSLYRPVDDFHKFKNCTLYKVKLGMLLYSSRNITLLCTAHFAIQCLKVVVCFAGANWHTTSYHQMGTSYYMFFFKKN